MSFAVGPISDTTLGVALAVLSLVTYGICMVIVSIGMRRMASEPGSILSAAAGLPVGLAIAVVQLSAGSSVSWPSGWAIGAFAMAGILSTYLGRFLVFKSIELIGPSRAAALQCTNPLITALLAWVLLHEHIGWLGFLGISLGIVGLAGTSLGLRPGTGAPSRPTRSAGGASGRRSLIYVSLAVGIGSSVAYSGSHIFRASAVRDWNEPFMGTAIGAAAGLAVLLVASGKRLGQYRREVLANPSGTRIFLGVGVLQFVAQSLVIASMKYIPASVAALISMCTPLVVMPISYFVMRNQEKLNGVTVLGILVTLGGAALSIVAGSRG